MISITFNNLQNPYTDKITILSFHSTVYLFLVHKWIITLELCCCYKHYFYLLWINFSLFLSLFFSPVFFLNYDKYHVVLLLTLITKIIITIVIIIIIIRMTLSLICSFIPCVLLLFLTLLMICVRPWLFLCSDFGNCISFLSMSIDVCLFMFVYMCAYICICLCMV